jgi:prevent-host-death family protein
MIVASITEAKNKLSALLDRVRAGESVLIVDRGIPVARIDSVHTDDARIARLERAGILRPPRSSERVPVEALAPGEQRSGRPSLLDAVLEERREGR